MSFYVGQKRRFIDGFKGYPAGAIVVVERIDEEGDPMIDGSEYGYPCDWYFACDLEAMTEEVSA